MIRLSDIKLGLNQAVDNRTEINSLRKIAINKLKVNEADLAGLQIFKKSIDARKKDDIHYVYTIDIALHNEDKLLGSIQGKGTLKGLTQTPDLSYEPVDFGSKRLDERPVIIGAGPAGLFAGLMLAKYGYRPIILERGDDVDKRTEKINSFWSSSALDTESNVQFGEGGAGTFSDGKLTTLINDIRCRTVLEEFIKAGAPPEILYKNKPHIGTDMLKTTIKNIRQEIIALGGEVRFRSKVTDLIIEKDAVTGVEVNNCEKLLSSIVLLAVGHSARDTLQVLYHRGINMNQKAFSIGVRIEHPQEIIDKSQYGQSAGYKGLGAADYKLSYHSKSGRSAYTFCMCPGGYVVAAASEEGYIVTNGMSEYKRDGENANSALLVGINPSDFGSDHPLAGIEFQRHWEHLAYVLGGKSYHAPTQLTGDFLADRLSTRFGGVNPTYKPGTSFVMIKDCLPGYVIDTLKEAIVYFDNRIKGFAMGDSILTGVETRSSSPVRINRDDSHQSNIRGLYPVGEGAGYAGGIMSSAVDGIRTAEKIMGVYAPL